jgi:F420-0:gamma-glutamyl ligase
MGESNDQKPIAVISGAQGIEFTDTSSPEEIQIRPQDDLYFGILKSTH